MKHAAACDISPHGWCRRNTARPSQRRSLPTEVRTDDTDRVLIWISAQPEDVIAVLKTPNALEKATKHFTAFQFL